MKTLTYKEFYIWLEGYLHGRLEDEQLPITPIIEKMGMVKSDEQKWIDDFKKYREIRNEPIIIPKRKDDDPYKPPFDITC
jgi:hypothetical protein